MERPTSTPRRPVDRADSALDLFDRWLARQQLEAGRAAGDDPLAEAEEPLPLDGDPGAADAEHGGVEAGGRDVLKAMVAVIRPRAPVSEQYAGASTSQDREPLPDVEFAPVRGTRRLAASALVLLMATGGVGAYLAWGERAIPAIGFVATLGTLATIVWAARAEGASTTLRVRNGQLEIIRDRSRHVFDLTSQHTPIDIVGDTDEPSWRVLFHRRGLPPYVVDASMVHPVELTRVLRQYGVRG